MSNDCHIRQATEVDLEAVHKLQTRWAEEDITWGYVPDSLTGLAEYLGPFFLVAESEHGLAGYALGKAEQDPKLAALPPGEPVMEVVDLYVIPSLRSSGVGSRLLEALFENANGAGISSFRLWSGTKDIARIVEFYGRHGFDTVGVEMVRRADVREQSVS